uniref:Uncharacterized protein n=1 Tax=Arion vulgaris TaxID=1028688 RepID=A0A0B7AFQ9_9EUPU
MRHHLYIKLKIGISSSCHWEVKDVIAQHVLQNYILQADFKKRILSTPTTYEDKLYGRAEILKQTKTKS